MGTLPYYDLKRFQYVTRSDGHKSKRYWHECQSCHRDRGFAYKNKVLKEPLCHACKMKQEDVRSHISHHRKHTQATKQKISFSLYARYGTNPLLTRIKRNLRSRLNKAVQGNYKHGSAVRDLGCSIEQFKSHLESKFQPGMTWGNYGQWHIDHIKPLNSFDLSDPVKLKEACHYFNLQPLWAYNNLHKRHTDGTFKK